MDEDATSTESICTPYFSKLFCRGCGFAFMNVVGEFGVIVEIDAVVSRNAGVGG